LLTFICFDWKKMTDDPRCCGTGTCIINAQGICWCGQAWNGEKMSMPKPRTEPLKPIEDDKAQPIRSSEI
jgi:hypothetical protein